MLLSAKADMAAVAEAASLSFAASRLVPRCQVKASQLSQDSAPILSLQSRSWTQRPQLSFSPSSSSWPGLFLFCSSFIGWFECEWAWDYPPLLLTAGASIESNDHRSSFARTNAIRHLVGSLTTTHGLRFAVVSLLSNPYPFLNCFFAFNLFHLFIS